MVHFDLLRLSYDGSGEESHRSELTVGMSIEQLLIDEEL